MKTATFIVAAATFISVSSQAQRLQDQKNPMLAEEFRSPGNVENRIWYETPDMFVIKYHTGNIDYRIDYNKKGQWLSTIRTYDEAKLPIEVRNLVKASYRGYKITLVEEIEKPQDNFTYIIHLEGKKNFINARVWNDQLDEWQKFDKSCPLPGGINDETNLK